MCGRFALNDDTNAYIEELVEEHGYQVLKHLQDFFPRYNLKPTNQVAIILHSRKLEADVVSTARWGLIPSYVKAIEDAPRTAFNATKEAIWTNDKGRPAMWRPALSSGQRCLIPASGYYEWTGPEGKKTPHWIHPDGPVLMFAGLYNWWRDPTKADDDEDRYRLTCTILTMPSVPELAAIHHRNPIALPESAWAYWIDPANAGTQSLVDDMAVESAPVMSGLSEYVVRKFGRDDDGPELLEPAA